MSALACPRCGAALRLDAATRLPGLPGCGDVLYLPHDRPDGRGKCRLYSGPPLCADAAHGATIAAATTLSDAREAPGTAD